MGIRFVSVFLLVLSFLAPDTAWAISFTYDSLHRLKSADYGNGLTIAYSYDSDGNRLSRTTTSPYRLITIETPDGGGSVTGAGIVKVGTSITLEAFPDLGKDLDAWKDGVTVVSRSSNYSFIVTDSIAIKAYFAPAFVAFARRYGLDPTTNGAAGANPSGDGVPNILKFALGGDPTIADQSILPRYVLVIANGGKALEYRVDYRLAALESVSLSVEYSHDFSTWIPAGDGKDGVVISTSTLDGKINRMTVTIPLSGDRTFARLRVALIH